VCGDTTGDFVPDFCSGNSKAKQGKDLARQSGTKARQGNIKATPRQGKAEGKAKAKEMHSTLLRTCCGIVWLTRTDIYWAPRQLSELSSY